ncbi:hypothetical protein IMZ48_15285 [Candidatus Bathyarchaeota archaeon]|nr:hypothetical protein [Candidatus Bathyarchaeota archaeon]
MAIPPQGASGKQSYKALIQSIIITTGPRSKSITCPIPSVPSHHHTESEVSGLH